MPDASDHFDILIASDLRFPGGTSASIVEEVKAQATAGYSTGLLHLPVTSAPVRPFNQGIRRCIDDGLATLVLDHKSVVARLGVIRNPVVLAGNRTKVERLRSEVTAIIVNQPASDEAHDVPYYDVADAIEVVRSISPEVRWHPIGPLVRRAMDPYRTSIDIAPEDWINVIDVDEWAAPRVRFAGSRPVIGRHSRPNYKKWPDTAEAILAAYPADGRYDVRVLGGAKDPGRVLGGVPSAWTVLDFNAVSPKAFLSEVDFFVYYHHPGWIEAFGRSILEAMASGAVAIVPPHFGVLFSDACVYAEVQDVQAVIDRLYRDWPAYRAQSERGQAYARAHFGLEHHIRRVEGLIGGPSGEKKKYRISTAFARSRISFVSSNGAGVGHLMRLLSMARRSGTHRQPSFFTLSSALAMVRQEGWPVEYLPTRKKTPWHGEMWNRILEERLSAHLEMHQPSAVVFDGTNPYDGLAAVRERFPDIPFIWVRRGMWKSGVGEGLICRRSLFDLVVEPGEVASAFDVGLTTQDREGVVRVAPIVLLDESDLLDTAEAKRALGLDTDQPAVLVQLGAGNVGETRDTVRVVVDRLRGEQGLQVCIAQAAIADEAIHELADVRFVSVFPLSRYSRAFDFAVLAAGYNSFHESMAFALPTIFIPNTDTSTDDQAARARFAAKEGLGLSHVLFDRESFGAYVQEMRNETTRERFRERCRAAWPGNGAGDAMAAVERLIIQRGSRPG